MNIINHNNISLSFYWCSDKLKATLKLSCHILQVYCFEWIFERKSNLYKSTSKSAAEFTYTCLSRLICSFFLFVFGSLYERNFHKVKKTTSKSNQPFVFRANRKPNFSWTYRKFDGRTIRFPGSIFILRAATAQGSFDAIVSAWWSTSYSV